MTKQKAAHLNESPFSVVTAYAADNDEQRLAVFASIF